MKRKLTKASLRKVVREFGFQAKVVEFLESLGPFAARRPKNLTRDWEKSSFRLSGSYREWVILSSQGMIGVSPYEDWIACVFDEPRHRRNGKWNFHSFAISGRWTDRGDVRQALEDTFTDWKTQVERMTTYEPKVLNAVAIAEIDSGRVRIKLDDPPIEPGTYSVRIKEVVSTNKDTP